MLVGCSVFQPRRVLAAIHQSESPLLAVGSKQDFIGGGCHSRHSFGHFLLDLSHGTHSEALAPPPLILPNSVSLTVGRPVDSSDPQRA